MTITGLIRELPPTETHLHFTKGFVYFISNGEAWTQYCRLQEWCWDRFGDNGESPESRWLNDRMTIWFRDDSDALEFKLRWF